MTSDWEQPGAHRVADGVYRIPLPLPDAGLRAVNTYLLELPGGTALVDAGWAGQESLDALTSAMRSIGHRPEDVERVLVTHAHRDHYTHAVGLRRAYGVRLSLGRGEERSLQHIRSGRPGATAERLRAGGAADIAETWAARAGRQDPAEWEDPDLWLDGDRDLCVGERRLRALQTPGHTAGHYVFADPASRLLFAGDHVLPRITPSIGFEPVPARQPLGDFLDSLEKVAALPDMMLLPAHGAPTASVHERVHELVAHHHGRLALCLEAVESGCRTALDVAEGIPWTGRGRRLQDLGHFDAGLAVVETLIHLELLVERGRVTCRTVAGVKEFHPR